jgi:hypothetical protein
VCVSVLMSAVHPTEPRALHPCRGFWPPEAEGGGAPKMAAIRIQWVIPMDLIDPGAAGEIHKGRALGTGNPCWSLDILASWQLIHWVLLPVSQS